LSTANKTSRWCWAYEGTPKSAAITAVNSTTYYFGEYDDQVPDWEPPSVEHPAAPYYSYNSREAKLSKLDRKYPTIKHSYNPTTAQFLNRFLKDPTEASPATFAVLDAGLPYPITLRHEQGEGSNPKLNQAVGCYTVGMLVRAALGLNLLVEEEFAYCSIEDQGDRPHLTTAPLASGGVPGAYDGRPYFEWNSVHRPEVIKVEILGQQNFKVVLDPTTEKQTVYCYHYEPVQMIINGVLAVNTIWDDFIDRNARTALLKVYKPDMENYITIQLTNCQIIAYRETGVKNKGHYEVQAIIKGETLTGISNFLNEGSNFSTHFKGQVT